MHILLTDVLTCPRCGPEFGLILLADRIASRRVIEGSLGCPNCRERYPVRSGFGDLRGSVETGHAAEPSDTSTPADGGGDSAEDVQEAFRLAALMGVAEGPGLLLLAGDAARRAPAVAEVLKRAVELVAIEPALQARQEEPGVSRIASTGRLPFLDRSFRAAAVGGGSGVPLPEAARVVAPMGRLVVEDAATDSRAVLEALGYRILAEEGRRLVAQRG